MVFTDNIHPKSEYVLGCDPSRQGADETAYCILEKPFLKEEYRLVFIETVQKNYMTEVIGKIIEYDRIFKFKKIYIDQTGLGAGVADVLKEKLGHRVEGITYTNKVKGELFNNLKLLMQQKKIKLPSIQNNNSIVKKLIYQFNSIQYEYTSDGTLKIFHDEKAHDDIINALCLAAWHFRVVKARKRSYGLA